MSHCGGCGYLREYHQGDGCPTSRTGRWRERPPVDRSDYRAIMRRDMLAREAAIEAARAPYVPVVTPPPRIPARQPAGPGELAWKALGLGRKAMAAGWSVTAHYWMRHDGAEGCAVKLRRDELYAVATWSRKPGLTGGKAGWSADIAYGLQRGSAAVKMTHTQLEGVVAS